MKPTIQIKPAAAGVKAALISMNYVSENDTPPALREVEAATQFTDDEMSFARYLIYDTDFGGAWEDSAQLQMHLDFVVAEPILPVA